MKADLPSIIVTGASGFVGRHFIESVKDDFKIFAIARRSAKEAGVEFHQNIHWIQWDISHKSKVKEIAELILDEGGADFILHLAAFYDFEYNDNPAYQSTNIEGTINVVELTKYIKIKRLIFASSTAAYNFPARGATINEKKPVDANCIYIFEEIDKIIKQFKAY